MMLIKLQDAPSNIISKVDDLKHFNEEEPTDSDFVLGIDQSLQN